MVKPTATFGSELFAGVMKPIAQAESLPPWCYTDADFFEHEQERVFRASWVSVGRVDRWQNLGDYASFELAGTPIIVLKDHAGIIRCFANTCRHRGTRLLDTGVGNCQRIVCPFHGWTYGLDGALRTAPKMEDAAEFLEADYGLINVPLSMRGGFVFVNLDGQAEDIDSWLGDFEVLHKPWSLTSLVTGYSEEFEVACNWKAFLEIFNEYYHLHKVHPRTFGPIYETPEKPDRVRGNFTSQFGGHKRVESVGILDDSTAPLPIMSTLRGKERSGTRYTWVYPALTFAASVDAIWVFEVCPLSPATTLVNLTLCFPAETATRPDFAERIAGYQTRMELGLAEDIEVLEKQQLGLKSTLARSGRFSPLLESSVHAFQFWLTNQLIRPYK